jgi:uncharacterized iron-regulated membrane protein
MLKWSIQLHKWIGLIVGVQVLGWVLGGLVMTAIPIERVRSEHHAAKLSPAPLPLKAGLGVAEAARAAGVAPVEATLKTTPRGLVWVLKDAQGGAHVVDARGGAAVAPIGAAEASRFAALAYKGQGRPVSVRHYAEAPQETGKEGPLWRVDFDDAERTAFYLSPDTGEVVSRRSNVWRLYDAFWRIHILDFGAGDNFNHPLIIGAAALSLPMVVTGLILLWIRLARDLSMARARARRAA